MTKLKDALMEALATSGLQVEPASPWKRAAPVKHEKVSLKLLSATASEGGAFRYLGLNTSEEECYGMKLTVELELVLMTPKVLGGEGADDFAEKVMELLIGGTGGLHFQTLALGNAEYDGTRDCFTQSIRVSAGVLAWGLREEESFRLESFRLAPVFA